ncbi:thioredoxin-disulfide reductase [soil metagenome]
MTEETIHDVVIIGSGPAGLTAALYAARADLAPLVIEGQAAGGQLMQTTDVENFPGFPDGRMGPELMMDFRKQAEKFGTQFMTTDVDSVDFTKGSPFTITVGSENMQARTVIMSTGATARWLHLENEQRLIGKGVSACATCDGFFFRDKDLLVVGGGDSAMEEATFLTKFASKVTVVHRRDELRASKIMQDRAMANDKIEFLWDSEVIDVLGDDQVTGVVIKNTQSGEIQQRDTDGLFLAIGHDPSSTLFQGQVQLDDNGYVLVTDPTTATNVPGVFAAGDITDTIYRQAITAAGQGCKAAMDAERWLEANGH